MVSLSFHPQFVSKQNYESLVLKLYSITKQIKYYPPPTKGIKTILSPSFRRIFFLVTNLLLIKMENISLFGILSLLDT